MRLSIQCARCVVSKREVDKSQTYACASCNAQKHITLFSPVAVKEWFAGTYKQHRWKCYDCLYPLCQKCNTRPTHAITIAWYKDGVYYCTECRFPRCSGCGKPRPAKSARLHQRFQEYLCEECRNPKCITCEANLQHMVSCTRLRDALKAYQMGRLDGMCCEVCINLNPFGIL